MGRGNIPVESEELGGKAKSEADNAAMALVDTSGIPLSSSLDEAPDEKQGTPGSGVIVGSLISWGSHSDVYLAQGENRLLAVKQNKAETEESRNILVNEM